MIVAAVVIPILAWATIVLVGGSVPDLRERNRLTVFLIAGYALRLVLFEAVMRRVAFFSHGVAGGDCLAYQDNGSIIAQLWRFGHVHFVTEHEMPQLGQASLPCNVLALFEYLGGEPAPLAGTAVNAFLAGWTVLLMYRFMRDAGADHRSAERILLLILFGPSFLYHTSDTYKDGVNAFLVIASLLNSVRIAQQFSVQRLVYLVLSLSLLWTVRHYMVFMCMTPIAVGFVGVGKATLPRRLAAVAFLSVIGAALFYTGSGARAVDAAAETYVHATSANVLNANAGLRGQHHEAVGSGVLTDSYLVRLAYTMFAPFPWQLGSFGLQLGKAESFVTYWFLYQVWRNRSVLWARHRATCLMMATFIVPGTLAYATTMSNVGLIVRQRMPLVLALALLAGIALSLAKQAPKSQTSQPETGPRSTPPIPTPPIPVRSAAIPVR